jgi:hypothetical protein
MQALQVISRSGNNHIVQGEAMETECMHGGPYHGRAVLRA